MDLKQVADSEAIRLPTLKELIGYPTTYYDDRTITTSSSSVLLHLLRNDVDNDISRQNVEKLLRGTDESQDGEKEIAQSPRDIIEETGDLWLQQASENTARSRTLRKDDVTNFDERVSVTNTIQEETKRKTSTNSVYLKPTTMRGISLVSLISSPVMRGFYITRNENVSSILVDSSTPLYTTTDIPVEQQTETILISDVSMTDETVTVAYNDQIESGLNILDDNVNINDKGIDFREEKYFMPNSSMTFSNAEISNHEKSDLITILVDGPTSKREKSLRNFDPISTPLSNSYVASSTMPTRRKIALAVNRYNEATTSLWTDRRIVARERNRTTVSPIKDAIRRTESDSIYVMTNTLRNASLTTEASTLASRSKLPTASTISTTSLTMSDDAIASPEILSVYNNLANSYAKTEDSESNATETVILTNSIIAATPSILKTISTNDVRTADISMFSDDSTIMTVPVVTNASVTSSIAVSKVPTVTAELAIIYTPTTINTEVETTPNYSVTDNPIIENAILTDPAATITFVTSANTESEIPSTNVNIVPQTTTVATDHVTTVTNTGVVTISIPVTASVQKITNDSANTTTIQITNANIGTTSSITNYSTDATPTTMSTHDVVIDSTTLITAANATAETFSVTKNYSTFTTVKNTTTIPVTTSPLTTVIPSTVNTQHTIHATAPMTTNNLADINTVTTNIMTTSTPLNVITSSINTNIPSTSATSEITPITIRSKNSSVTSPKALITNTDITSTNSVVSTILTTESSTIHLANSSNLNISSNSEILAVTTIVETTQITEIPTTFEIPSTFTSTTTAYPKPHSSTNFEALSVVTATLSNQGNENSSTPVITQTPLNPLSIATLITNKTTVAVEKSTASMMPFATTGELIAINSTIRTTTDTYESDFVRTTSESLMLEQKTDFKETTSMKTQNRTEDQTITTISKLSSAQTMRNEFTAPEIKMSEETISKITENQKQNQTILEFNTTNNQFSQKTARRRVLNRTNNWLGSPSTLQRTNQYPRRQVMLYRKRSQRPAAHISSSKAIEKNRKRRIIQKRIRVNSGVFNNTIKSDLSLSQDTVDVQNITDHAYDQVENIRRRKVVLKERVKEETNTILPTEETTVFLQTSTIIENENIKEKQEVILKQSEESLSTTTKISTNSSSANESFPDNTQNNLYVAKDPSKLENPKNKPKSEEKNLIEGERVDFDSINTNLQDNFSKSSYADMSLSDKRIARKRMRVVLKNVRSKIKNSTIEKTNVNSDFTNKNFQNNFLNNHNISQNFSNEEKRRKMRVVLKRIKSKSEEEETKTEKASTEDDFTNESLQGTFSNNFYSAKNFPIEYRTRRRMRVVLKSVKPKTEEKNPTVEEITIEPDSINESLQGTFSNNFRSAKNFPIEYKTRRMRIVLKSVKLKSDPKKNSTVEGITADPNFTNGSLRDTFSNNFRKNFPVKHGTKRRMRVALKSIKPRSEEKNLTLKETSVDSDSNFSDKDFQDSFSSNLHENLFNGEDAQRGMEDALKSVKSTSKERDSVAEETNIDSDFVRKDSQVLNTFHFSSNVYIGDNLPDKKKIMKHSKSEEEQAITKQPEDMESQTTRTSVPVEKDTDRFSLEVTNGKSINRNSESGHSNRRRKPTPFTTIAPLTNTLSNTLTVHRRRRPVETTISSRIDLVDAFEGTESYVKPAAVLHDQNADVSDQSIRAQEFAVTLSDPPSSTSDIGRTPLRNVDRRKISTTVVPRTDPTTSRTVSRYDMNFQNRQRSQTKDRPTLNATTRPRRPPVIDYDYYEDEAPIVIGKSVLNSKLFLTSKGAIRCMDQGNFPHPYSCKKFISCARMVNGQVIGTEYTCPDKLSFDPVGGICNWSAGLGCKD